MMIGGLRKFPVERRQRQASITREQQVRHVIRRQAAVERLA